MKYEKTRLRSLLLSVLFMSLLSGLGHATAPSVTINYPNASAEVTNSVGSVNYNYSVTDDLDVINVSVYTNQSGSWALQLTDTSGTNGSYLTAVSTITTYEGNLMWNVVGFDNATSAWGTNTTYILHSTTTTTYYTNTYDVGDVADATGDLLGGIAYGLGTGALNLGIVMAALIIFSIGAIIVIKIRESLSV